MNSLIFQTLLDRVMIDQNGLLVVTKINNLAATEQEIKSVVAPSFGLKGTVYTQMPEPYGDEYKEKFNDIDIRLGERQREGPINFTALFEQAKIFKNTEIMKLNKNLNRLMIMLRKGFSMKDFSFDSNTVEWIEGLKKRPDTEIE